MAKIHDTTFNDGNKEVLVFNGEDLDEMQINRNLSKFSQKYYSGEVVDEKGIKPNIVELWLYRDRAEFTYGPNKIEPKTIKIESGKEMRIIGSWNIMKIKLTD